jgi:hypothetical protein
MSPRPAHIQAFLTELLMRKLEHSKKKIMVKGS